MSTARVDVALMAYAVQCQIERVPGVPCPYDGARGVQAACVYCGGKVTGFSCRADWLNLAAGRVPCGQCGGPVVLTAVL